MCLTPQSEWSIGMWRTGYMAKPLDDLLPIRFLFVVGQESSIGTLKVLNFAIFAIFDHFHEILCPHKASKPQNHEIKYS